MQTRAFADPFFKNIPCVISIGVFDGLHLGHQAIVDSTVRTAAELGASSVVISFSTNPKMAAGSMPALPALQSTSDFEEMLANRGVNYHCVIDFSLGMSKLSGEEFIALLCTSYDVKAMVVGNSFRAGRPPLCVGPSEIPGLLCKYTSAAFLRVTSPVLIEGQEVSSSLIRRCLLTGEVGKASALLGRAYSLDLRGRPFRDSSQKRLFDVRTLGLLLPRAGRYMVEATEDGRVQRTSAVV